MSGAIINYKFENYEFELYSNGYNQGYEKCMIDSAIAMPDYNIYNFDEYNIVCVNESRESTGLSCSTDGVSCGVGVIINCLEYSIKKKLNRLENE